MKVVVKFFLLCFVSTRFHFIFILGFYVPYRNEMSSECKLRGMPEPYYIECQEALKFMRFFNFAIRLTERERRTLKDTSSSRL